MKSNVFALDLQTGRLQWRHLFSATNEGPNGLAVDGGRVYGATDSTAFALDAKTGRLLWRRFVVTAAARFVDVAPLVADGIVYMSTIGLPPNGKGVLYALDAATGAVRWKFDDDQGAVDGPVRGRRRRRVVPAERRRRRRLLGHDEPVPVRRDPGAPERRRLRRAGAVHRLAARARRPDAARSSGTTR